MSGGKGASDDTGRLAACIVEAISQESGIQQVHEALALLVGNTIEQVSEDGDTRADKLYAEFLDRSHDTENRGNTGTAGVDATDLRNSIKEDARATYEQSSKRIETGP